MRYAFHGRCSRQQKTACSAENPELANVARAVHVPYASSACAGYVAAYATGPFFCGAHSSTLKRIHTFFKACTSYMALGTRTGAMLSSDFTELRACVRASVRACASECDRAAVPMLRAVHVQSKHNTLHKPALARIWQTQETRARVQVRMFMPRVYAKSRAGAHALGSLLAMLQHNSGFIDRVGHARACAQCTRVQSAAVPLVMSPMFALLFGIVGDTTFALVRQTRAMYEKLIRFMFVAAWLVNCGGGAFSWMWRTCCARARAQSACIVCVNTLQHL